MGPSGKKLERPRNKEMLPYFSGMKERSGQDETGALEGRMERPRS